MNALHVKQLPCASSLLIPACKRQVQAGSRGGAGQTLHLPLLSLTTLFTIPLPVHAPHSALVPTRHALPLPFPPCRAQRSMPRQPVSHRVAAVSGLLLGSRLPAPGYNIPCPPPNGAFHGNSHTFIPYWVNDFQLRGSVEDVACVAHFRTGNTMTPLPALCLHTNRSWEVCSTPCRKQTSMLQT